MAGLAIPYAVKLITASREIGVRFNLRRVLSEWTRCKW